MRHKAILIVGLFSKQDDSKNVYRTAADQLAELFRKNNIRIIKTSYHTGKLRRLADTMHTIFSKCIYELYHKRFTPTIPIMKF